MTPEQRDRLAIAFIQAFKKIGTQDVIVILPLLINDHSIKAIALDVVKEFLTTEGYALQ